MYWPLVMRILWDRSYVSCSSQGLDQFNTHPNVPPGADLGANVQQRRMRCISTTDGHVRPTRFGREVVAQSPFLKRNQAPKST